MGSLRGQELKLGTHGELVSRLRMSKAVLHFQVCSYGVHKHRVLEDSYTPDKNSFPFPFDIILWLFLIVFVYLHLFTIVG